MDRYESDHFATLDNVKRIWAVSAIHSDVDALITLHEEILKRLTFEDGVIYLGNIIGKGLKVRETIDELLSFRRHLIALNGTCQTTNKVIFLRGAQEEMWHKLLQVQLAINPVEIIEWLSHQGVNTTLLAYDGTIDEGLYNARGGARDLARWTNKLRDSISMHPGHREFLSSLKRAAVTNQGSLLFVNCGLDPQRPLDAQRDSFWWDTNGFEKINSSFCGFKKVIRGYSPHHPGIQDKDYKVTIDSGAGSGGSLIAACIDNNGQLIDWISS